MASRSRREGGLLGVEWVVRGEGEKDEEGVGGGGMRHIEFAKSGRTIDRKPSRKEDEPLPMKCHCLCDVT